MPRLSYSTSDNHLTLSSPSIQLLPKGWEMRKSSSLLFYNRHHHLIPHWKQHATNVHRRRRRLIRDLHEIDPRENERTSSSFLAIFLRWRVARRFGDPPSLLRMDAATTEEEEEEEKDKKRTCWTSSGVGHGGK